MGLKKLVVKVQPRRDPKVVTIELDGEPMEFSRPKTGDISPTREALETIVRSQLGLRVEDAWFCHVLGRGYIPTPEEGKINPTALFAEMAVSNDLLFSDLCRQWGEAFPEFSDWFATRLEAKNASRASSVDSPTESSTLPPDLDTAPTTSQDSASMSSPN